MFTFYICIIFLAALFGSLMAGITNDQDWIPACIMLSMAWPFMLIIGTFFSPFIAIYYLGQFIQKKYPNLKTKEPDDI